MVRATTHWQDAKIVAEVSRGVGEAMRGLDAATIPPAERLQARGW
jgi:pyridoxal 5'-phosphate synthase pdxS subunit